MQMSLLALFFILSFSCLCIASALLEPITLAVLRIPGFSDLVIVSIQHHSHLKSLLMVSHLIYIWPRGVTFGVELLRLFLDADMVPLLRYTGVEKVRGRISLLNVFI
jgi:hypothetical protein